MARRLRDAQSVLDLAAVERFREERFEHRSVSDHADEREAALAPLQAFADPIADVSGRMPYADFQRLLDEDCPDGMRCCWESLYLDGLPGAAIDPRAGRTHRLLFVA